MTIFGIDPDFGVLTRSETVPLGRQALLDFNRGVARIGRFLPTIPATKFFIRGFDYGFTRIGPGNRHVPSRKGGDTSLYYRRGVPGLVRTVHRPI